MQIALRKARHSAAGADDLRLKLPFWHLAAGILLLVDSASKYAHLNSLQLYRCSEASSELKLPRRILSSKIEKCLKSKQLNVQKALAHLFEEKLLQHVILSMDFPEIRRKPL
jgi:hypothetical protein